MPTLESIRKSKVTYASGLMLIVPKENNAPILFLEWMAMKNAGQNILHKVINTDDNCLKIRLNLIKEEYQECSNYINANI